MAKQTKLERQIAMAMTKIQQEQNRLSALMNQQADVDRLAKEKRSLDRHDILERILPETIKLTKGQFREFVEKHIANDYGRKMIADFIAENEKTATAEVEKNVAKTPAEATSAPMEEPPQISDANENTPTPTENPPADENAAEKPQLTHQIPAHNAKPTPAHSHNNGNHHSSKKHNGNHNNSHKNHPRANGNTQTTGATN